MPKRKEEFYNENFYHITLRRVADKLLFKNINDYYRGIFSIYEFNNSKFVEIKKRRQEREQWKKEVASSGLDTIAVLEEDKREKLVEILAFCFMPNHIHLLLKQIKDGGISKFMQKFGTGFSRYFKEKHHQKMSGHFFQDKFRAVHIESDNQLRNVFVYIHTNPIALIEPKWKEKGIINPDKAIKFIENYKWSSYQDYLGIKNFSFVSERLLLLDIMDGCIGCKKQVDSWVKYKNTTIQEIALED